MSFELPLPDGVEVYGRLDLEITAADGFRFERILSRYLGDFQHKMGLQPGRYTLRAATGEGHAAVQEFDVEAGTPLTVRANLR